MRDSLVQLGLSPTEALTYEALLENGPCFVAPLVRATKKHRQIVYNALENLVKKSLVAISIKNGKHYYSISEPKRFVIAAHQQYTLAQHVAKEISSKLQREREQVDVLVGADSYANGLSDFRARAEEAQEYIVIGGQPKEWYEFTKNIFADHVKDLQRMKRQGIPIQILFFESERASAERYIKPHLHNPYSARITQQQPRFPHTSWLAGNYVYILTPTQQPCVIKIHSPALAKEYREYFWSLWSKAQLL